jgi:hypothetical protein
MSTEQNCNNNAANQEEEGLVSPAVPFWMRVKVKPENSALSPEADAAEALENGPESDETFAVLMHAIQGTEIARRLGGLGPRVSRPFQAPALTEPPADAAVTANSDAPIAGPGQSAEQPAEPTAGAASHERAIEDTQEDEEICTNLLRAIEGTSTARQLGVVASGENACAQEPALAEAVEAVEESPTVEAVCETPPPAATAEVEPAYDTTPLLFELGDAREKDEACATLLETTGAEIAAPPELATAAENIQESDSAQHVEVDAPIAAVELSTAEATGVEQAASATPLALDLGDARESDGACITSPEAGAVSESTTGLELTATAISGSSQESALIEAKETEAVSTSIELPVTTPQVTATETEPFADASLLLPGAGDARENDEACATSLQTAEGTEIAAAAELVTPAESGQGADPAQTEEMDASKASVEPPNASTPPIAAVEAEPALDMTPRPLTRRAGAGVRRPTTPRPRRRRIPESDTRRKRTTKLKSGGTAAAPPVPMELLQEAAELPSFESPILPAEEPVESTCQPAPAEPQPPAEVEPALIADAPQSPMPEPPAVVPEPAPAAVVPEPAPAAVVPEPAPAAVVPEPAPAAVVPESAPAVIPSSPMVEVRDEAKKTPVRGRLGAGKNRAVFRQPGDYLDRAEMHLESWFLKWFDPPDPRRRSARLAAPPLTAYHWAMDVPQGLKIANVSAGGMYLLTDQRWTDGVIVSLTLQRTDMPKGSADSWIAVDFVVTRWCEDGIAGAFIPSRPGQLDAVAGRAMNCADKKALERFMAQLATPAQVEMGKEKAAT